MKFLLLVLACLSFCQIGGTFYSNLGAVELLHAVVQDRPIYITEVTLVRDPNLTRAGDYLHQSLALSPESISTAGLIAMVAAAKGDWNQVANMSKFVTQRSPFDIPANILLGYAYWHMNRIPESIQAWRQAKAAVFLCHQAALYHRDGKDAKALELYALARQVDPQVVPLIEARVDLAWAFYFSGRKDEAFVELRAAIDNPRQEDWESIIARGEMGMYYLREGQWQDAIEYYQWALALGPGYIQYRLWLGDAYMKSGKFDLAENELRRTIRDTQVEEYRSTAYYFLGELYALEGQTNQSVSAYAQAVRISPDNLEFRLYLARAYENAGQWEQALSEWESMLTLRPDDPQLQAWYDQAKRNAQP